MLYLCERGKKHLEIWYNKGVPEIGWKGHEGSHQC